MCPSHRAHEENQMSRVGSLFNVGPTEQAWVLRFGDQFLYPWSHLKTLACHSHLFVCLFCILRIELTPHKTTNPTSIYAIASFILSALYKRPLTGLQYDLYMTFSVTTQGITEPDYTCSLSLPYSMTQNQACIIHW